MLEPLRVNVSRLIVAALLTLSVASQARAQALQLDVHDGLVWLNADHVSLGEIVRQWARTRDLRVVRPELLEGVVITLRLSGVPESEAVQILLRGVTGYVAVMDDTTAVPFPILKRLVLVSPTAPRELASPVVEPARDEDDATASDLPEPLRALARAANGDDRSDRSRADQDAASRTLSTVLQSIQDITGNR